MVRKKYFTFILVILLMACSGSNKEHSEEVRIDLDSALARKEQPQEGDIEELLGGSIELVAYEDENTSFTPTFVTHNNKIFGSLGRPELYTDMTFAYYDLDTSEYVLIKKAKGNKMFASVDALAANDDAVVFFENNQEGNDGFVEIYLYTFADEKLELIHTIERHYPFYKLGAEFVGDDIYFCASEDDQDMENIEEYSSLYCYNMKSKEKEKIRKSTNLLKKHNDYLYYIAPTQKTNTLMRYNTKTKKEMELLECTNGKEHIFGYTLTDDELIFLISYPITDEISDFKSYRYNFESKELEEFVSEKYMEVMQTNDYNYLGYSVLDDRFPRGKKYLYDLDNNINYNYEHGPLTLAQDSILWTRFNTDYRDIPKFEVYAKGNTTLMYKKIEGK